jgi:CHAD domain-containing protein
MRAMTELDGVATEVKAPGPRWKKAKTPPLRSTATAEEALTGIVVSSVAHLRGNEACVLARAHEEGIHQMRVAGRRLRSALTLYRAHLPEEQFGYLNGELKWLIRELGSARDWDVFVDGVLRPVQDDLTEEPAIPVLAEAVEEMRDEAYARAAAAIKSQRYAGLILLLKAWAEGRRWHDGASKEQAAAMRTPAAELARHLLDQGYEETLALAGTFSELSAEERHSVRIRIKKLRYATEFFGALFPRRQVVPYLAAMKALQDQLGLNNDVEVARGLLKKAPKRARGKQRRDVAYAGGLVIGWHSHVSDHREQNVLKAWDRFVGKHPFWRPAEAKQLEAPAVPVGEPAS